MPCASRAEASVKSVILLHTKLCGYQEEGASITPLSFPRCTNPRLHALHPPAAPAYPLVPAGPLLPQTATERNEHQLVTPRIFWPVIQKSLHNPVNSLRC